MKLRNKLSNTYAASSNYIPDITLPDQKTCVYVMYSFF